MLFALDQIDEIALQGVGTFEEMEVRYDEAVTLILTILLTMTTFTIGHRRGQGERRPGRAV